MNSIPDHHRILVIDDNAEIHNDFRKILDSASPPGGLDELMADVFGDDPEHASGQGFKTDSAYQGREGLEKVQQAQAQGRPYSVAFVDMRMPPGWDGVETISRIWAVDPLIQIVICTAYSDYSWKDIVSRLGNSDRLVVLKKPFDTIEVMQMVHALTRKWLLTQQASQTIEELNRRVKEQTAELQRANRRLREEIAELEETRFALRLSEERLSEAFAACPMPIAILSLKNFSCVEVNQAYLDLTARPRQQVLGKALWHSGLLLQGELLNRLADQQSGHRLMREECTFSQADGTAREALIWIEPFQLGAGAHLLAVVQDVTEQRQLEQQFRQSQKLEAVGQLAAGVAHDLNNLLTVILGHTSVQLLCSGLDGDMTSALTETQQAGERAATLTRQLLAFSRKQIMKKMPVCLANIVRHLESMLRRLIPENIALCCDLAPALPLVLADVGNIEQVIVNLVVNSRDAMPGGGNLMICTGAAIFASPGPSGRRPGEFICLSVSDNGMGMPPEIAKHIFEPFYTTKAVGKGSGMGLATVQGIVEQHGGWIELASRVGEGTTFSIYLPVTRMAAAPTALAPGLPASVRTLSGNRKKVLLVEDDHCVRKLAHGVLKAAGYDVMEAPDGREAVALWRKHPEPIDLLMTDMVMPGGLSGKEVAAQFSLEHPEAAILYTSGYSVELFGEEMGLQEGLNYLPKPYLAKQLIDVAARACSQTAGPHHSKPAGGNPTPATLP